MAWAVDVSIVSVLGLILNVRDCHSQDLRRIATEHLGISLCHFIIRLGRRPPLERQRLGNGCRQSRLPVVNMTNGTDIDVGLCTLKPLLSHLSLLFKRSNYVVRSTRTIHNGFHPLLLHFCIVMKLHSERTATLRHTPQFSRIPEHPRERDKCPY